MKLNLQKRLLLASAAALVSVAAASALIIGLQPLGRGAGGAILPINWALVVLCWVAGIVALAFFMRKAFKPMQRLEDSIKKIADGDMAVRTAISSQDELGRISQHIDSILTTRVSALMEIESENERLNDSVIQLLETVGRLAQKDLTARAKVSADITAPISDALNLMSQETSKVLKEVTNISTEVAESSSLVKNEADNIVIAAKKEKQQLEQAKKELAASTESMLRVANLAQASAQAATQALVTTRQARSAVTKTVTEIEQIRDSIREAEKRIKRLGERSQEIAGVIGLINQISERTQVLALNASMRAASAGEAGRGFGVVSDEVQRLAENTRDATTQITSLVGNIQSETKLMSATMNELIAKVVEGSRTAEQSGQQMQITEESANKLTNLVQLISNATKSQAKTNRIVQERASLILDSVSETGGYLLQQSEHVDQLLEQAMSLVQAVSVFSLPEDSQDADFNVSS